MPPASSPTALRMKVINPAVIVHVMEHPARGVPWKIRDLAEVLGCSAGTISHMRTEARKTFPAELAHRFAEAVGVETAVIFAPAVSTESDTTPTLEAVS